MATFADVVKRKRQEGSSRTGALASAIGQKTLESIDPRKFLNQSGTLTALFPSLKAYKAKGAGDKSDKNLDKLATLQASGDAATKVSLEAMIVKLNDVSIYTRMSAKNSVVLPQMARDTNLIKQNIGRLLKVFGETQATKADMFFKGAGERESAIEAARKKTPTTPTKVEDKKDDGFFSKLLAPLAAIFAPLIASIKSFAKDILDVMGISKALAEGLSPLSILLRALISPLSLLVAPVAALAWWLTKNDKKQTSTADEWMARGGGMDETSVVTTDGRSTKEMVEGIMPGGLPAAMRETQREQALKSGYVDPSISEAESKRLSNYPSRIPSSVIPPSAPAESTSPTKVNDDSQVDQILATIRAKESGGGNPAGNYSALNFAWNKGQTASGAYQITKPTWDMWTKKYGIGQDYEFAYQAPPEIQDQVARRAVKDILKQVSGDVSKVPNVWYTGNAQGKLSESALALNRGNTAEAYQKSWMAKYNQLAGKETQASPTLASTKPSSGPTVSAASSSAAEGRMMLATAPITQPNVIQDNSTKVQNAGQGSAPQLSAYDPFMFENLVTRVS